MSKRLGEGITSATQWIGASGRGRPRDVVRHPRFRIACPSQIVERAAFASHGLGFGGKGNVLYRTRDFCQTMEPVDRLPTGDTCYLVFVDSHDRIYWNAIGDGRLRTGDRYQPFPEEVNRRIADIVADLHFAPTARCRAALLAEGTPEACIHVTGNTVVDALLAVIDQPYDWSACPLAGLPPAERLVVVTAHRRESFGTPLRDICLALRDLAGGFADGEVRLVYPVHLNPNVRRPVYELLGGLPNVSLIEPLGYRDMAHLMRRAALILTDSGGIQEEAPTFGVPVLVMRDTTERPEGIDAGVVRLVGANRERIVSEAERLLRNPAAHAAMATRVNPYGDGRAASRIVSILLEEPA